MRFEVITIATSYGEHKKISCFNSLFKFLDQNCSDLHGPVNSKIIADLYHSSVILLKSSIFFLSSRSLLMQIFPYQKIDGRAISTKKQIRGISCQCKNKTTKNY